MDDPRPQPPPLPPPLHYWREPPAARPGRVTHWKGILAVVFILLMPALLLVLLVFVFSGVLR